jgi:UDP-glucose 4-epimerase
VSSTILVTGGAGYIGSHACVELAAAGHRLVVIDNLCNADAAVLARLEKLTGQAIPFYRADIRDRAALDEIFRNHPIAAVMHFAGLKAVGESVDKPIEYYANNVTGSLVLFDAMRAHGVKTLVFSSSATVYGDAKEMPIREDFPIGATNPYGRSKLIIEEMLRDIARSDADWHIALLRYFNPVGAHASGLIGESPSGIPNNLMPYVCQVAAGMRPELSVFGNDYPTHDGTGVRDFIHVVDLARGHLAAIRAITERPGVLTCNLGTGSGYSVLDLVHTFERINGVPVPYRIVPRRPGDVAVCYADPGYARQALGWTAELGLEAMVRDAWGWQQRQPGRQD